MDNVKNTYKYKLQYLDGESIITHEFPADIDITELKYHLRDFLVGCSWAEKTIEELLGE